MGEAGSTSNGHLFWDDGTSIDTISNGHYTIVHFTGTEVMALLLSSCHYFSCYCYKNSFSLCCFFVPPLLRLLLFLLLLFFIVVAGVLLKIFVDVSLSNFFKLICFKQESLSTHVEFNGYSDANLMTFDHVTVMGVVSEQVARVLVNGVMHEEFNFDSNTKVIHQLVDKFFSA